MGKCIRCATNFVGTPESQPQDALCRYCERDELLQTDRLKTKEINILIHENRALVTQVRLHAEELIKLREENMKLKELLGTLYPT